MENKKGILLLLGLFFFYCSYSQDRVNGVEYKFEKKSPRINNAKLWIYDEPKWKSRSNVMRANTPYSSHNFVYIRFNKLLFDGQPYFVLVQKSMNGDYKYPSICEGWYDFEQIEFFAYTAQDYQQLKEIKKYQILILENIAETSWSSNWGEVYNEHKIIATLKKWINKTYPSYARTKLIVTRTTSNGLDVVRFLPPDGYKITNGEEYFKQVYYEVSYSTFKTLFID